MALGKQAKSLNETASGCCHGLFTFSPTRTTGSNGVFALGPGWIASKRDCQLEVVDDHDS